MPSLGYNIVNAIMNSQQQADHTLAHQQPGMDGEGAGEPYPSLMNYFLLLNSGKGGVFVLSCVAIGDPPGSNG